MAITEMQQKVIKALGYVFDHQLLQWIQHHPDGRKIYIPYLHSSQIPYTVDDLMSFFVKITTVKQDGTPMTGHGYSRNICWDKLGNKFYMTFTFCETTQYIMSSIAEGSYPIGDTLLEMLEDAILSLQTKMPNGSFFQEKQLNLELTNDTVDVTVTPVKKKTPAKKKINVTKPVTFGSDIFF